MNDSKAAKDNGKLPFGVGDAVLIRTVTMTHVGRIKSVLPDMLVLSDGGWVADTGRFSQALAEGSLSEFERAPAWFCVSRAAIVDVWPWAHDLPQKTK